MLSVLTRVILSASLSMHVSAVTRSPGPGPVGRWPADSEASVQTLSNRRPGEKIESTLLVDSKIDISTTTFISKLRHVSIDI